MTNINKGYNEMTGLYTSRYYAKKAACSYEVVTKVDGGYKIMDAAEVMTKALSDMGYSSLTYCQMD